MSDQQPTDQQPGTSPAVAQNTEPTAEHMIPKSRFDEVNNALRAELDAKAKREQAERAAADKAAAERGEWERLASERAARVVELEQTSTIAAERIAAYEGVLTAQIKARVKALPEAARSKLPESDPLSQLNWLDAVEAAVQAATPTAPRPPLRTPPGPGGAHSTTTIQSADLVAAKRASGDYAL